MLVLSPPQICDHVLCALLAGNDVVFRTLHANLLRSWRHPSRKKLGACVGCLTLRAPWTVTGSLKSPECLVVINLHGHSQLFFPSNKLNTKIFCCCLDTFTNVTSPGSFVNPACHSDLRFFAEDSWFDQTSHFFVQQRGQKETTCHIAYIVSYKFLQYVWSRHCHCLIFDFHFHLFFLWCLGLRARSSCIHHCLQHGRFHTVQKLCVTIMYCI